MKLKFNKDKLIKNNSYLDSKVWLDLNTNIYWNEIPKDLDLTKYYEKEYWSTFRQKKEKSNLYKFSLRCYKLIRNIFKITPNLFYSNFLIYSDYINIKSKILEIGCGKGEAIIELSKKKYSIKGLDLDIENVIKLNDVLGKSTVALGNYEEIEIEEKFDFIYLNQVLEHFRDLNKVILKLKSNLNKGGHCFISVPNADSTKFLGLSICTQPHTYHFTKKGLENLFINAGFTSESINYYGWKAGNRIINDIYFSLIKISGLKKCNKESEYLVAIFKLDKK